MSNKELALQIAEYAFRNKTDLAGHNYIDHLKRVAKAVPEHLYISALLHDLLEDCPEWNEDSLRALFPSDVVITIVVLTKGKDEDYMEYIHRVSQRGHATQIKIADLRDNLDTTRLPVLEERHFARLKKYHDALKRLEK